MEMNRLLVSAALAALPALATAHDFWVDRTPDGFAVRRGHRGGELLPVDPARVKVIRCVDAEGAATELRESARPEPGQVRVAGPCAAVSVFHDGGYWSLTPEGEVNLPKNRAEGVVKSWASRQYAKWVDAGSPRAATVFGDELEIVPVTDLGKTHEGDKVTVRVLSGGRPVPGAAVAIDHRTLGETDSKGELRLRLRTSGVESVSASVRRPRPAPEADAEVLEASLTFEVRK
jgi:uncharacterized GH25 family protein